MALSLPPAIRRLTEGLPCQFDSVGLSDNTVLMYPDRVLKIGPRTAETDNERIMLRYLDGRLPVARMLAYEEADGLRYLLTTRVPGVMACDASLMCDLPHVARLLADGLRMLWAMDVTDCPSEMGLDAKLRTAEQHVIHGDVSTSDAEPGTYGPGGFAGPEALLHWLQSNRPEEEPVLSHGDFCLPNILIQGGRISGFIDLGRCGRADRWMDIALCHRSLMHNCSGFYGSTWPGWNKHLLFDALGLAPDWERLRYYILLDELF